MRIILVFSYLFLLYTCSYGQSVYFSKQYSMFPDLPSVGVRITTMPDGYAFTTLEGASNIPKGSVLVITDKQGNFIHTKQFLPKGNQISGLVYHPEDSSFHIWGSYYIGAGKNLYRPYIVKTNWWGDTLWVKEFDYTGFNLCRNAIQLPDGGFIMALTTSIPLPDSSILGLIRVDSLGNEVWHKKYRSVFYQYEAYGLHLRNDSTLMVGYWGTYLFYDTLAPPSDAYGIMEVDLEGNIKRDTFYLMYTIADPFTGWLAKTAKNRYAFVNATPLFPDGALEWINCIDEDYNLLWQKHPAGLKSTEYAPAFTINKKGNIVSGGIMGAYGSLRPFISEMTPDGELLWWRVAKPPVLGQNFIFGSSFEAVRQTDDGGYIITGNFQHPDGRFQTWLLKLDSLGCFEPGCETGNLVTVDAGEAPRLEVLQPGLELTPNPADGAVTVRALKGPGRLVITDVQGRLLDSNPIAINDKQQVVTQHWPPGNYILRYVNEKGELLDIKKLLVVHAR